MEEKEKVPNEEAKKEEPNEEEPTEQEVVDEEDTGKIDYARKWFIVCIVLFVILIALAIVLHFIPKNEGMWNGGSIPVSSPKELFHL